MNLKDLVKDEYSTLEEKVQTQLIQEKPSQVVLQILTAFEEWLSISGIQDMNYWNGNTTKELLKNVFYSKNDITNFTTQLPLIEQRVIYQKNNMWKSNFSRAGIFLSSLINFYYEKNNTENNTEEIILFLKGLEKPISYIGYHNAFAHILIHGDSGICLGTSMTDGEITLLGSTCTEGGSSHAGQNMKGGILHLPNARNACSYMSGGKIHIKRATGILGWKMEGGEIYISESYEKISEDCKGKIYFKGKLIHGEEE